MKIAHITGKSQVMIKSVPVPTPGPGEVLIRTIASAVCGSEMGVFRKEGCATGNLGHEAAGVVAALGKGTQILQEGQRVGVSAISGCGHCEHCKNGRYTWCENLAFHCNMHAEYFVIPETACHIIPDDVPWGPGVLITGDGLGVPYHTSTKIQNDDIRTVVVFGLGPIGLGNILLQSFLGRQVIGVDRAPDRLALAKKLGAKHTIAADKTDDVVAEIRALSDGHGADAAIEAAGIPITAKQCFKAVRKGGIVVFNGEQPSVELSPSDDFIRRDITAVGSWFYHFNEYPAMLCLYRKGLSVDSLITHHYSLDQADEAYRAMAEGKSGKVIFEYTK
ncbi:MAG: zinc-binding dehydrogenase [Chthoniobacteraceae bacterium]